ncbi:hydrolase [Virgisporangium aliadipatigenens]|uniref:Hydrolase n=1 Tax=Virgisporangium aliadipatigenens TaxID=741659 RepID=A0A8J4DN30_9ACTN|nr:HAD hydrolase-like protein [Virgisporangium aliadipatigenens]GIJ44425.1 hydrolase [Virgisporangium aliadipatigenens]
MLVGFDLDMTLLDTRPGIAATYRALSARTGVHVDADLAVSRLGPPLQQEMSEWFPADEVPEAIALYRSLYPEHAIAPSVPLPGAVEAVAAVRAAGLRAVVVTAKLTRFAQMHLRYVGLEVDEVVGDLWAEGKAEPLRGGLAYVGDHVADVRAARTAGVRAIAVATGPCSPDELRVAGADDVLPDLTRFPLLFGAISVGARADG